MSAPIKPYIEKNLELLEKAKEPPNPQGNRNGQSHLGFFISIIAIIVILLFMSGLVPM